MEPKENKFHQGNRGDGKHYWLTPDKLMNDLNSEFHFDTDPCPYPKPEDYDGLTSEWGYSSYVNPPFGSIMHMDPLKDKKPKKKGITAWVRKSIKEYEKGNKVVLVFPVQKWVLMLLKHATEVRNLGDVKWIATEDGSEGKGIGPHIACFVLDPQVKINKELEISRIKDEIKRFIILNYNEGNTVKYEEILRNMIQ